MYFTFSNIQLDFNKPKKFVHGQLHESQMEAVQAILIVKNLPPYYAGARVPHITLVHERVKF